MKKFLLLSMTILLGLSISACTKSPAGETATQNRIADVKPLETIALLTPNSQSSTVEPAPSPVNSTIVTAQTPSESENDSGLKVIASFVYKNDTYIVVENTGEKAILNYKVIYVHFDKNGFATTTDSSGFERGKKDAANLLPGDKEIGSWYGASGNYAVATVCAVEYADGTSWEMTQTDLWAKNVRDNFTVAKQEVEFAELKDAATLAETNEFATLIDTTISHGNQFSSSHDINFTLKNTSGQGITRINLFILEYDKSGFPVSVSPYDTYCLNGHQTGGTINLAAGQSNSYTDDLFLSPTTTQIKAVISYIEFQDGSDWTNPYIYEWVIANNSSF